MAVDLAKMEAEIGLPNEETPHERSERFTAEMNRFTPRAAATMESIQNDIRRTIDELDKHTKRLDEYRSALQADVDRLRRNCA